VTGVQTCALPIWISSAAVGRRGRRSGRKRDQIIDVSSIQRQFENAGVLDNLADAGISSFHECGIRLYFHLLGNLSDFEYRIDDGAGVNLKNDSGLHEGAESRQSRF